MCYYSGHYLAIIIGNSFNFFFYFKKFNKSFVLLTGGGFGYYILNVVSPNIEEPTNECHTNAESNCRKKATTYNSINEEIEA